jgi:Mitotic-spindle organizing gamma-tubulin ring associated
MKAGDVILQAMSDRLETGLNAAALSAIQDLLEAGCHPDAVVAVVMSLSQR